MFLLAFRDGLRASELCELTWDAIDFRAATIHINRKKNGQPTTHQISGPELRELRKLQREQDPKSAFVFVTEPGTPFDRHGFTGLPFQAHAHMLRLYAGQRRQGYSLNSGLSRPQGYPAYRPLHRAIAEPVQELLSGLTVKLCWETPGSRGRTSAMNFSGSRSASYIRFAILRSRPITPR